MAALSCPVPEPPVVLGEAHVVGDGSAASCTTTALNAALELGGKVSFNCGTAPVTLTVDAPLLIRDGTELIGGGLITLDGNDQTRIMRLESHATASISGLTFQHGNSQAIEGQESADGSGGAIYRGWQSHLDVRDCDFVANHADATNGFGGGAIATASSGWTTLVRCNFSDNDSRFGGAVYSLLSDLTIVDCQFAANRATESDGGAIFTDGAYTPPDTEHGVHGGIISICGSTFLDNSAESSAGAGFLFAYGIDQLQINRSEFRDNHVMTAEPGLGGALRIDAEAFVSNSLFANNQNAGQGGAIWMGRGPATFDNVTFFANQAALWGGAISYGDKTVTLNNCTIARNTASEGADALFGNAGALTANNTLFANNGDTESPSRHCSSRIAGKNNLAFPAGSDDVCGNTLLHEDPVVADSLADLGGATQTLALGAGSAAIDAGADCTRTDQRGEPRSTPNCDIGAFEY